MSREAFLIQALRAIATDPAARGLTDDAAVLDFGSSRLVLTMDAIVEGVHFLSADPPETIAWKLVATNVSDLAAKGAVPRGCLLAYALAPAGEWDAAFLRGLHAACLHFEIALLGGDTVRPPSGALRSFALVALGEPATGIAVPSRSGAANGDDVWISAPIGDSGLGLAILLNERDAGGEDRERLIAAYRTPRPDPKLGAALAPHVNAMMDVSDGLLIDAKRLAEASGRAILLDLSRLPLSPAFVKTAGDSLNERLFAAGAGDDYCLLFTASSKQGALIQDTAAKLGRKLHRVGSVSNGSGLKLLFDDEPVPLPARLGFEH